MQQTALWQQVLGDGFNDLTADVDHDLRTRFRTVTEDAERQIDSCDPTAHWAEIGNDVENAIATAVGDNFVWAYQRSEALADDVARSFADAGLDSVLSAELSPTSWAPTSAGSKRWAGWNRNRCAGAIK